MLTIWKQQIQPVEEYCSSLMIPHKRKEQEGLEAV